MKNKIKFLAIFLLLTISYKNFATNQKPEQEGQDLVKTLYTEPQIPILIKNNDEYLDKIVKIMHYLCSKVPEKNAGEEFSSGAIIIEDKDWKLHQFLLEYVKKEFADEIKK